MPFEPLRTDEKLPHRQKAPKDMDSLMLTGCFGFVMTSLLSYFLSIWPHLVFHETYKLSALATASACGLVPSAILGVLASRKFDLPGACGFVGGSMATCVFLFLRLQQVMLAKLSPDLPLPEYPSSWVWLVPGAWLCVSAMLALAALPRQKDDGNL